MLASMLDPRHLLFPQLLALLTCAACSSDELPASLRGGGLGPLYALMYKVEDDSGIQSYLGTFDGVDAAELDIGHSREFPGGQASMRAYDVWLFVGTPQSPEIARYNVDDSGALVDETKLSFGDHGFDTIDMDDWGTSIVSPTKAYSFDRKSGIHVIWNPEAMEITGEIPAPENYERDGFQTETSGALIRDGKLYRDFYWFNRDDFRLSDGHMLAVYDTESDELLETHGETRCPAPGSRLQLDEAGDIYLSNLTTNAALTRLRGAAESCLLRIPRGETTFDADWSLRFADVTGGQEGGVFTYLGAGQGVFAAFDGADITVDANSDPHAYYESASWRLWHLDLPQREASVIEEIPANVGVYTPASFDGRNFVLVPNAGGKNTNLFELQATRAKPLFELPGSSLSMAKLRD